MPFAARVTVRRSDGLTLASGLIYEESRDPRVITVGPDRRKFGTYNGVGTSIVDATWHPVLDDGSIDDEVDCAVVLEGGEA